MYIALQMTGTVLLSLIGSTMLKLSDGFSNLPPTLLFIVTYCLAFYLFSLALRTLPLSVGYAVWSGCSTAGNALVGHICFNESLGIAHIFVLLVIILGIILINNARITNELS
ncbi:MAG: multidrug efflux SMR transporter [Peptococcaceae bacterium]|nr:multidrug efflux SMR transporter [Peptococcaceae bacterium]